MASVSNTDLIPMWQTLRLQTAAQTLCLQSEESWLQTKKKNFWTMNHAKLLLKGQRIQVWSWKWAEHVILKIPNQFLHLKFKRIILFIYFLWKWNRKKNIWNILGCPWFILQRSTALPHSLCCLYVFSSERVDILRISDECQLHDVSWHKAVPLFLRLSSSCQTM